MLGEEGTMFTCTLLVEIIGLENSHLHYTSLYLAYIRTTITIPIQDLQILYDPLQMKLTL